ncbi:MAG: redoxin domain-containing protein [Planctomycetota bacterium]|nr:redoxin domain-containing protein [Planctomycetota bacterium]
MPSIGSAGAELAGFEFIPASAVYAKLEGGFFAEYQAWMKEIQRLAASGGASSYPAAPDAAWYPRMRALADLGDLRARLWCLRRIDHHEVAAEQRLAYWRGEAYGLATALRENEEFAMQLRVAAASAFRRVGDAEFDAWLDYLGSISTNADVQRGTVTMRMGFAHRSTNPQVAGRAAQWEAILLERWPESTEAQRLLGKRFAEQNLKIGMTAPEFVGKDVDGKEIRLSSYRGKVVVLDFWGFW